MADSAGYPRGKDWLSFSRICKRLLQIYLIYFVICFFIPPMFHGTVCKSFDMSSVTSGQERVLCVEENEAALLWRLRMISQAEEEIILSTFDLRDDNSGRDIIAALFEAADRGVNIRILIDGVSGARGLRFSSSFRALAAMPNVEIKLYSPVSFLKPWMLNYRMHDKYLIIDDTAYLLGGRNTCDLFLGGYVDSYNIDRDVLVYEETPGENSSLTQLRDYFSQVWALESNQQWKIRTTSRIVNAQEHLRDRGAELRNCYPEAYEAIDWKTETLAAEHIALLSNPVKPWTKGPRLWTELCTLMQTGTNIQIQTPYIICDQAMYTDLSELCGGGRTIQIMTNAVENGANPFGCTDYLNQKSSILDTGVEVVEWMGGQSLHTKTVLVDDAICVIGSFNLDMRSTYLDTELMLVIDCPTLNQELRADFERKMEQSKIVSPDGSTEFGVQYNPVELSLGKTCFYWVLRITLWPVRYLL